MILGLISTPWIGFNDLPQASRSFDFTSRFP